MDNYQRIYSGLGPPGTTELPMTEAVLRAIAMVERDKLSSWARWRVFIAANMVIWLLGWTYGILTSPRLFFELPPGAFELVFRVFAWAVAAFGIVLGSVTLIGVMCFSPKASLPGQERYSRQVGLAYIERRDGGEDADTYHLCFATTEGNSALDIDYPWLLGWPIREEVRPPLAGVSWRGTKLIPVNARWMQADFVEFSGQSLLLEIRVAGGTVAYRHPRYYPEEHQTAIGS